MNQNTYARHLKKTVQPTFALDSIGGSTCALWRLGAGVANQID